MAQEGTFVIRNVSNFKCGYCDNAHEYISAKSDKSPCATPMGYSYARALEITDELGLPEEAIEQAPHFELVRLDESARKLPRGGVANAPHLHREVIQPII